MQFEILKDVKGAGNATGTVIRAYKKGEIIVCEQKWQTDLAKVFVSMGAAKEIDGVSKEKPEEQKKKTNNVDNSDSGIPDEETFVQDEAQKEANHIPSKSGRNPKFPAKH